MSSLIIDLIQKLCPQYPVGVEIGVFKGSISKSILDNTTVSHLYLVDPYESGYTNFTQSTDGNQRTMDTRFKKVSKYFAKNYPNKSTFIRKKSEFAHSDVPDDLDFIYIDGNHAYEYVLKDLKQWVPKVKSGGLVMGDDWHAKFPGVISAVQDYCRDYAPFEPPCSSYKELRFKHRHVNAPGSKNAVVNKSHHTWWSICK